MGVLDKFLDIMKLSDDDDYYDDDDNIDIWVDVDMPPVFPRCEFVKLIC